MRLSRLLALILLLPGVSLRAEEAPPGGAAPEEHLMRFLSGIWNHEIDTGNLKISIGKIFIGLILLVVALMIAHTLSGVASRAIRKRFTLAIEHAEALEKGIFYLFATIFILTALNWLSIPLTVFAFLGGAIVIGVGFGTQALMNNFISGLILLFERGIRVGDLIEVDGNLGRVTKLGSRCSQVRKPDGVEVLVPNSMFLERNVVNWTLSDSTHRYDFTVGFAYGTNTETALKVLKQVLDSHPEVLRDPAPAVYFDAFGDSALVFHLYYWISLEKSTALQVGSDLRLSIDRVCREAGIAIPLPQREMRLQSSEPITVRVEKSASERELR